MNAALGLFFGSLFLATSLLGVQRVPHGDVMTPERIEGLIAMETRECVAKADGDLAWCRQRAERKILSAAK